jgi:hypothetical protein
VLLEIFRVRLSDKIAQSLAHVGVETRTVPMILTGLRFEQFPRVVQRTGTLEKFGPLGENREENLPIRCAKLPVIPPNPPRTRVHGRVANRWRL